jgi:uncharacterized protein
MGRRWLSLTGATLALWGLLSFTGVSSAPLLGAMLAGLALAVRGEGLTLPRWTFSLAQAAIGCLLAVGYSPTHLTSLLQHPFLFAVVVASVLLLATGLGLTLTRLGLFPGSTALWGSFPGAASAMVVLARDHGADMSLVAFMQYLRLAVVVAVASLVARLWGGQLGMAHAVESNWAVGSWTALLNAVALIVLGGLVLPRLHLRAGPLLGTMAVGLLLRVGAGVPLELPSPLVAAGSVVIGWTIGLRFSRQLVSHALAGLPRVLASTLTLVALCAGLAVAVSRVAQIDLLTAYFATSPGGADTIAILIANVPVDAPLVMAIQIGRTLSVLVMAPLIAKLARPAP